MKDVQAATGSFRDPGGRIFFKNGRVFRTVSETAAADFEFTEASGLIPRLEKKGMLAASKKVNKSVLGATGKTARYVLEHDKIPFVSYPYEWPPALLKTAALLQLEILTMALDYGVTLSDASAYNVQFIGARPIFIDRLSFIPYQEGQIWQGYKQFCEQFLFPLMLVAYCGVPYHAWYRGALEGIPLEAIACLLPFSKNFSPGVFKHVTLQNLMQRKAGSITRPEDAGSLKKFHLAKNLYRANLTNMRKLVAGLETHCKCLGEWRDYELDNTYAAAEAKTKKAFVTDYCKKKKPKILWDMGCNTGVYSRAALAAGAGYVVGFDGDLGALELAAAGTLGRDLLPLYMNFANVSPSQGWLQKEREGLEKRQGADGILALALVHHLAISGNIPLDQVVGWLTGLAPAGVIEFVPKGDPMVQRLLLLREDIFPDYDLAHFEKYLKSKAKIVKTEKICSSGRTLYWYQRK